MVLRLLPLLIALPWNIAAQPANGDSITAINPLPEATVRAFDLSGFKTVPATVAKLGPNDLKLFGNTSILPAVNAVPGVRMEERSPGSYRLAIRGSSLRAPFGVRNIKVYYNGIPFTDPGGNTYLTQLGYYSFAGLEVIKGPAASIYGAGAGGALLIESLPTTFRSGIELEGTMGSYGLKQFQIAARLTDSTGSFRSIVRYQQLTSDGYREHSSLNRKVISWDVVSSLNNKTSTDFHLFYSDVNYETPGGLTLEEYQADPRQSRPRAGVSPGAAEAGASVAQKGFLAGGTLRHSLGREWTWKSTFYGAFTEQNNPSIRNRSLSNEPHAGGRSTLQWSRRHHELKAECLAGAELQTGANSVQTYSNRITVPDTLQSDDRLRTRTAFAFTQATIAWRKWLLLAGASYNLFRIRYRRQTFFTSTPEYTRDLNGAWTPRLAVGFRASSTADMYASVSKGFSPPASSELSPTGGALNSSLQAEQGWNYEAGFRGQVVPERLHLNVAAYLFELSDAIVQWRDAAGGDYYINSGRTRQMGLEAALQWQITGVTNGSAPGVSVYAAYSFQYFRYREFRQLANDFSGNAMPGVAPNTLSACLNWQTRSHMYVRANYSYADLVPLNDANTTSLPASHLLSCRVGYKTGIGRWSAIELFAGGDNLLDQLYSAGPDINAFGGRYYNAASGITCYFGLGVQLAK